VSAATAEGAVVEEAYMYRHHPAFESAAGRTVVPVEVPGAVAA